MGHYGISQQTKLVNAILRLQQDACAPRNALTQAQQR